MSPVHQQKSIWSNAGLLLFGPSRTHLIEIWIKIQFLLMNLDLRTWWPFFLGRNVTKKNKAVQSVNVLSHWGWVMHICFDNLTINASDNGLSPGQCQAIIWTSAGILLTGPLGTNFSETLIKIHTFSFKKMHLNMLSGKCLPFCLRLNVLSVEAGWVAGGWGWGWVVVGINESRHLLI